MIFRSQGPFEDEQTIKDNPTIEDNYTIGDDYTIKDEVPRTRPLHARTDPLTVTTNSYSARTLDEAIHHREDEAIQHKE
jgi:hypothetical protein